MGNQICSQIPLRIIVARGNSYSGISNRRAAAHPRKPLVSNVRRHLKEVYLMATYALLVVGDRFHPFVCGHGRSLKPDTREPW